MTVQPGDPGTIRIGPVGVDIPLTVPDSGTWQGDTLTIGGDVDPIAAGGLDRALALRRQFQGLATVPQRVMECLFADTPELDDFYRAGQPKITSDRGDPVFAHGSFGWSIDLERVGSSLVQSRVQGAVRTNPDGTANDHTVGTGSTLAWHSPGVRVFGYQPTGPADYERVGADGTLLFAEDTSETFFDARPQWFVAPGDFRRGGVWVAARDSVAPFESFDPLGDDRGLLRLGPPLLSEASAWWDARDASPGDSVLRDLSGGGSDLALTGGDAETGGPAIGPAVLGFDGERYLFSPGWDDKWVDAPVSTPAGLLTVEVDVDATEVLAINPHPTNTLVHQGDGTDFSHAMQVDRDTGIVSLLYSVDGTTILTATSSVASTVVSRRRTLKVTRDPVAGLVRFFEDGSLIDSAAGTAGALHASSKPLAISGFETMSDAADLVGWGSYYRVRVWDDYELVADLDPSAVDVDDLTWSTAGGYPAVGPVTHTSEADFDGGASETWMIHNYQTPSYDVVLVDRPVVLLGNHSSGRAAATDEVNGSGVGSFSFAVALRDNHPAPVDTSSHSYAGHVTGSGPGPGWVIMWGNGSPAADLVVVADSTPHIAAGGGPIVEAGQVAVLVAVVDRDDNEARLYVNGVLTAAGDISAVGSIASAADLLIGGLSTVDADTLNDPSSLQLFAAACWDGRILTAGEAAAVTGEAISATWHDRYDAVVGTLAPPDPTVWALTNSLIAVVGSRSTEFSEFSVVFHNGTRWGEPKTLRVTVDGDDAPYAAVQWTVLANTPEGCRVRVAFWPGDAGYGVGTIDFVLRRGARHVECLLRLPADADADTFGVRLVEPEAGTDHTSGIHATNPDSDGNYYILSSPQQVDTDNTGGAISLTAPDRRFAFMVGAQIGAASAPDDFGSVVFQYFAASTERQRIIDA